MTKKVDLLSDQTFMSCSVQRRLLSSGAYFMKRVLDASHDMAKFRSMVDKRV